jgi:predicted anti-sigma-YlaC factor YlaD
MSVLRAAIACDRFREQVSLSLDGELSQLEHRMLDAHLARCPSCSAFADDVRSFTDDLRAAPLERPLRPIVVQRRRRIATARLQVGVAAAFALAALGLGTQLSTQGTSTRATHSDSVTRFPTQADLAKEIAIIENMGDPPVSPRAGVL